MLRRTCIALFIILLAFGAIKLGLSRFESGFVGPRHEFTPSEHPTFLTESLALAMARKAMDLDGLDPNDWLPHPDDRTIAPDGRRDEYFSRNGLNPNQGSIDFRGPTGQSRYMSVELSGERIICQGAWGK